MQGLAADVYGRLGPALTDTLARWAELAREHDQSRGMRPKRWLHLWRTQLSVEIATGIGRLIHTADFDTAPGKQHRHPQPPGVAAGEAECTLVQSPAAVLVSQREDAPLHGEPEACTV